MLCQEPWSISGILTKHIEDNAGTSWLIDVDSYNLVYDDLITISEPNEDCEVVFQNNVRMT
jgi:hypothetical protein